MYSSRRRGVNPQFLETMIFWRPGNLYCDRRRASRAIARSNYEISTISNLYSRGLRTGVTGSDGQNDLTDVDTSDSSVWLSPSTTHSGLESIGSGTRQHLVDTDDVVWVGTNTEMETFLSGQLDEVPNVMSVFWPFNASMVVRRGL